MKKILVFAMLPLLLSSASQALAVEARDTLALPSDTLLMILYFDHAFGNEYYSNFNKKSDSQNLTQNMSILRAVYYKEIFGHTVAAHILIPFGGLDVSGSQSNGVGDITPLVSYWFIDNKESKFGWATSAYVTIPTGQYRPDSSVNFGSNRWAYKQEMSFNKGFGDKFWLELVGYVQFFTDNTNVTNSDNRKVTLSKDPLFDVELHASYNFTKEFWASADYYFNIGGEETLDGVRQKNRTNTHTVGMEFAYMINQQTQILLNYKLPVSIENGIKTNELMARLTYAF